MGNFLMMSGVIGADRPTVEQGMRAIASKLGRTFRIEPGKMGDAHTGVMADGAGNTTLLYPNMFSDWDDFSRRLSIELQRPVFSLHVHDGDLWMFILFENGDEVSWFNTCPDYWGDIGEQEETKWAGDAQAVAARIPGLDPETIRNYFVPWTYENLSSDDDRKAYPDDEFAYGNDWQILDFMRRIGLTYPDTNAKAPNESQFCLSSRIELTKDRRPTGEVQGTKATVQKSKSSGPSSLRETSAISKPPQSKSAEPRAAPAAEEIIFQPSGRRTLGVLAAGLIVTPMAWVKGPGFLPGVNWLFLLIGCVLFVAFLWMIIPGACYLKINRGGIKFRQFFRRFECRWDDIDFVQVPPNQQLAIIATLHIHLISGKTMPLLNIFRISPSDLVNLLEEWHCSWAGK